MSARRTRNQAFSLFAFQDIITAVTGVIILVMLLLTLELIQIDRLSTTLNPAANPEPLLKAIQEIDQEIESLNQFLQSGNTELKELASLPDDEAQRQKSVLIREIDHLADEIKRGSQRHQESLLQNDVLQEALEASSDKKTELKSLQQQIATLQEQLEALQKKNRIIFNPNAKSNKRAWLIDISVNSFLVAELGRTVPPVLFDQESQQRRVKTLLAWANTRNSRSEYFILLLRPETIEIYKEVRKELEGLSFDLGFDVLGNDVTVIDPIAGAGFLQ